MIRLDNKSGKSIHEQIQEGIKELIISGVLKEDDKLPSVRELSISLTVNPNTVQKAYKELEISGIIYSVPGKGNFVSEVKKADSHIQEKLMENLRKILSEIKFSGIEKNKVTEIVDNLYKEEQND